MSRQATNRRKVLVDHVQKGKVLVPPFIHQLGELHEVSWIQTMIPELCWIGLLHDRFGNRQAVQLITSLSRASKNSFQTEEGAGSPKLPLFIVASDFNQLSPSAWMKIRDLLEAVNELRSLREGLLPIAVNYPTFPLRGLWEPGYFIEVQCELGSFKELLKHLYDRRGRTAMMVQATAIWLWFDSGRLKVFEGLTLLKFPEIERYPETELSRQVGSSIRASLNSLFGFESCYDSHSPWPIQFWNRGLDLEPCEFPHE